MTSGEKGIVERITNAIDAVIEKQKRLHNLASPKDPISVIKKAFPNYYSSYNDVLENKSERSNAKDAENQVIVAVNDGSKSNKPTIDIIDKGVGLKKH